MAHLDSARTPQDLRCSTVTWDLNPAEAHLGCSTSGLTPRLGSPTSLTLPWGAARLPPTHGTTHTPHLDTQDCL